MQILFTAFNGKTNSSKQLLDLINTNNKLYLKNSFTTSVNQLIKEIRNNDYDLIISFGQAHLERDTIKIETQASLDNSYNTNYNYVNLKEKIETNYKIIISNNAGNYLCNNLYYYGLKYILDNNLKTKMIFIHIPKTNNISNIALLASIIKQ